MAIGTGTGSYPSVTEGSWSPPGRTVTRIAGGDRGNMEARLACCRTSIMTSGAGSRLDPHVTKGSWRPRYRTMARITTGCRW